MVTCPTCNSAMCALLALVNRYDRPYCTPAIGYPFASSGAYGSVPVTLSTR